jgi:hypothetical protein
MLVKYRKRALTFCTQKIYLLMGVMCLFMSCTLIAHAMLTVSDSGLWGDADVAVDTTGNLNLGTSSSTQVTIGKAGVPVLVPGTMNVAGTLTLGSASTTGQLIFNSASSSFTTILQASSSQSSNLTFTLPPTLGTAGQAMLTDGTGNFYFGDAGGLAQWITTPTGISYNGGNVTIGTAVPVNAPAGTVGASVVYSPNSALNVKAFGAKGDGRTLTDVVTTAGSPTITSASAAFTADESGKTITVAAGTIGMLRVYYHSGGTISGSAGQTCLITAFSGGGSGATATLVLTGTNAIADNTQGVPTGIGSGYSGAGSMTSATLSSGTATCSGTATVSVDTYVAPITATLTVINSTTATMNTPAVTTQAATNALIATDDSAAINSAITAAYNAGGGEVYFPHGRYLALSQIALPNDGATLPAQPSITIVGDGADFDPWVINKPVTAYSKAATVLDLRYSTSVAKIDTRGKGVLQIKNLSLEDHGSDTLPFIQTTNTTLFVQAVSFFGSGPGGPTATQDAIVLGGTTTNQNGTATSAFQGYGTVIERCYFARVQRGVYGRVYANSVVIANNTWSNSSGGAAAIEFDGTTGFAERNFWYGNQIEMFGYARGVTFRNSIDNYGSQNAFWDERAGLTLSDVTTIGGAYGNSCLGCGFGTTPFQDQGSSNYFSYFSSQSQSQMEIGQLGIGRIPAAGKLLSMQSATSPYFNIGDGGTGYLEFYGGASGPYVLANGGPLKLYGTGAQGAQLDNNATANETRLLLYDPSKSGGAGLVRVSVGANDSAGAGKACLAVPNH